MSDKRNITHSSFEKKRVSVAAKAVSRTEKILTFQTEITACFESTALPRDAVAPNADRGQEVTFYRSSSLTNSLCQRFAMPLGFFFFFTAEKQTAFFFFYPAPKTVAHRKAEKKSIVKNVSPTFVCSQQEQSWTLSVCVAAISSNPPVVASFM